MVFDYSLNTFVQILEHKNVLGELVESFHEDVDEFVQVIVWVLK